MAKCDSCGRNSGKSPLECPHCKGHFCRNCIVKHKCTRNLPPWIFIVGVTLIIIILFMLYAAFSFTTVDLPRYVISHQNLSNKISFSEYLNDSSYLEQKNVTLHGFVKKSTVWSGPIGVTVFSIVDDSNNEIRLHTLFGLYNDLNNILRKDNISKNLYSLQGIFETDGEGLAIQIKKITPFERPPVREIVINTTIPNPTQSTLTVPKFPGIRNFVSKLLGIKIVCESGNSCNLFS